jgi:hypothetical protein
MANENSEKNVKFLTAIERRKNNLFRESDGKFRCQFCNTFFTRVNDCVRHEKNFHNIEVLFSCKNCGESFQSNSDLTEHRKSHIFESNEFKINKEVFNGASRIYRLEKAEDDLESILTQSVQNDILKIIISECALKKRCLFSPAAHCAYIKFNEDGDVESRINIVFASRRAEVNVHMSNHYIKEIFSNQCSEISKRIEDFTENGSGWTLSEVFYFDLSFVGISSIRGGCALGSDKINQKTTRGLLNIKNDDNFCLIYCILAKFHSKAILTADRSNPKSYQPFFKDINLEGINFPISIDEITLLENQNSNLNFKINVFIEVDKEVIPARFYNIEKNELSPKIIVNVLLKELASDNGSIFNHYILIENEDKFFASVYTSPNGTLSYSKTYTCPKCISRFSSENKLSQHDKVCKKPGDILKPIREFKKEGETLQFQKPWLKYPHLFTGFFDFESNLIKSNNVKNSCKQCDEQCIPCIHSYTQVISSHKAVNYCFIIVNRDGKVVFEKVYTGEDAVENFIETLCELEKELRYVCSLNENMVFTKEDKKKFNETNICHICRKFIKSKNDKVRDHCHASGRFIGPAHNTCNMNRKERPLMKILAHNFSGYDSHLVIEKLDNIAVKNISVIPKSGEKFMAVEINNTFTLCDSMSFLTGSLDALSSSLGDSHDYNLLKQATILQNDDNNDLLPLLLRKWNYRKNKFFYHVRVYSSKNIIDFFFK